MCRYATLLCSLLSFLFCWNCGASALSHENAGIHHQVPSFSVNNLSLKREALMSALTTTGLISIDEMDITYDKARTSAFQGLCDCTQSSDFLSIQGTERATLLNIKSATRTTLATATVGSTLLSLPQTDLERICGVETAESMEILRDYVAHVSEKFMRALDTMINPQVSTALLKTKHGVEFTSIQSIVQAATNLEHFHVYSKPGDKENEDEDTSLLPLHTDAGLFLTFVPGMSCHGGEENIGHFYIESPISKQQERAVFAPNTIGIMLGHGAQHWLHYSSGIQLRATRHAVKLNKGESRAWFGKMHLVPQHALVKKNTTFADLQRNMRSDHGDVSIGCGSRQIKEHDTLLPTTITRKRRLQHITNGSSCNNVTNHFCWMTCQDIPDIDKAQEYLQQGKSLYCLEPAVLASTNQISSAVDACTERNVVGGAMNEACIGSWQSHEPGVTCQNVNVSVTQDELQDDEEPWCYGGTSMYMDGFQWIDSTCVIYLFPTWVLRTPAAIVGACFATLIFGICLEGVIFARRRTVQNMEEAGWKQQVGVSTLMYGIQLTMGYMLMLVVMTYSGPLFLCVVVGLMLGHLIFNSKVFNNGRGKGVVEEKKDDTYVESATNSSSGGDCCGQEGSMDSSATPCVPEGSTPCCQNTLNEPEEFRNEERTWMWPIRKRKPRYQTIQ